MPGAGVAWFVEHWSYRWMFWAGPAFTLVMIVLVYLGVPSRPAAAGPRPSLNFNAFLYASVCVSLIYGTLEQGERLDWLSSGTIVDMLVGGGFLIAAAAVRRAIAPKPLVNFRFLGSRNTLNPRLRLVSVHFVLLSLVLLVPGFLGVVQGYRALETGRLLIWGVIPFWWRATSPFASCGEWTGASWLRPALRWWRKRSPCLRPPLGALHAIRPGPCSGWARIDHPSRPRARARYRSRNTPEADHRAVRSPRKHGGGDVNSR
jgi:hypothetical protein